MKKIFSNKKVMGTLAAVMAAALLLGGTFAWRDISQNAQNVFKASSYEAELVDIFTPPSNWEKDENINKDVYVKNTGSGDIFVRVNFDDILKLAGASEQAQNPYTAFTVNGDGTADTTSFGKFEWAMGNGLIYDIADWNGCTDAWYLDATTGWFYWGNVLNSGTQTDKLLDAVKLLTDVDKDFEYIINVNMHAFSADQKGIEDLEDTDGGSANVPDEVKDMVNGIVSKSEAAAKDKAFEERVKEVYGTLPADKEIKTEADGTKHIVDKATGDYILDRVNFPDEAFYEYVKQFDIDNDGKLSQVERDAVKKMQNGLYGTNGNHGNLKDLTGVEIFTELTHLSPAYNQLTTLDVSNLTKLRVLNLNYNPISEIKGLDVVAPNLISLSISSTKIKDIDFTTMPALTGFVANNTPIKSVDLSNNPVLINIGLSATLIEEIDITMCSNLKSLEITDTKVQTLDISQNSNLQNLYIEGSDITTIDLNNNAFLNLGISSSQQLNNLNTSALLYFRCHNDDGSLIVQGDAVTETNGFFAADANVKYTLGQKASHTWNADETYRFGILRQKWSYSMEQQDIGNQQVYLAKEGMALAIGGTQNGNVIDLAIGDQVVTVKGIYTLTSTGTLAVDGTITATSADWTPINAVKNHFSNPTKTLAEASGTTVAATVVSGELTNHK